LAGTPRRLSGVAFHRKVGYRIDKDVRDELWKVQVGPSLSQEETDNVCALANM
jgi:hypothetical protein